MRRFTITPERIAGGRVAFDRGESRHLSRVLRLRSGDTVLAADGTGREYTVRLETVGEQATGTVLGVAARASESPVQITLLQSVPKGDKMESIVRACTELGVAHVVPVLTTRTVVTLEAGRWRDRARRWQRVASEAAKQCGRAVIPTVSAPRPLADVLARDEPAELKLCLWEGATTTAGPGAGAEGPPGRTLAAGLPPSSARGRAHPPPRRSRGRAEPRRSRARASVRLDDRRRRTAHLEDRDRGAGDHRGAAGALRRSGLGRMSARAPGWEHFETEADVGVEAWGPTRAEAFAQAALGVFALIVKPEEVAEREHREVRAQADSPERLLASWINECLYVHEIEGFCRSPRRGGHPHDHASSTGCSTARSSTPDATGWGPSSRPPPCTGWSWPRRRACTGSASSSMCDVSHRRQRGVFPCHRHHPGVPSPILDAIKIR